MKHLIIALLTVAALATTTFAQKKPVPPKKTSEVSGSMFYVTIEHNGEKTDVEWTEFKSADGNATLDGSNPKRVNIFFGASNDKDDKSFSFNAWVPETAKGVYSMPNGPGLGFISSVLPPNSFLVPKSLTIEITAMPLPGGFVEGSFTAECQTVTDAGTIETYNLTGRFKVRRMS